MCTEFYVENIILYKGNKQYKIVKVSVIHNLDDIVKCTVVMKARILILIKYLPRLSIKCVNLIFV